MGLQHPKWMTLLVLKFSSIIYLIEQYTLYVLTVGNVGKSSELQIYMYVYMYVYQKTEQI